MSEREWRLWPLVRRLRPVRSSLAAAVLWFAVAAAVKGDRDRKACEEPPVVARQTSLDGAWEAVVVEAVCHFAPAAGMTYVTTGLRLISTRNPSRVGRILEVDTTGRRDYVRPFPAWTAPGVSKVTVAKAPMTVMALDFDGVHVDLRVDPDDPAIKAAVAEWRRSVGLPPEPERKDEAR